MENVILENEEREMNGSTADENLLVEGLSSESIEPISSDAVDRVESHPEEVVPLVNEDKIKPPPKAQRSTASNVFNRLYAANPRLNRCLNTPRSPFKSMAEMNREFMTKARIYPFKVPEGPAPKAKAKKPVKTCPVSPKFQPTNRRRSCLPVTSIEPETYRFKATPLNRKIFDPKYVSGVPRIASTRKITKAVEPQFHTEDRIESRRIKITSSSQESLASSNSDHSSSSRLRL